MGISLKHNTLAIIILILVSWIFLARCARQGSPSGGPEDETPPVVVSEIPANRTIFFNFMKATITFDEFISLEDPAKEIFISPPMRTKPEYKVAGKKLIIEFQEELKENSTYTINFGNAIVDFTAGNPLTNYEYVFSTGSHIDSLSIPGNVLNAFNHLPEPAIIVMVYQDNNDTIPLDSLPLRVPPRSASRTTKDGSFRINNLASGVYKLFAMEDQNNNYIFDLPNERIAFLDSLVTLDPPAAVSDSLQTVDTDTTAIDSLSAPIIIEDSYTLLLFSELNPVQKLLGKKMFGRNLLQYIFQQPVDSVTIRPVGFNTGRPDWYLAEYGVLKDTVNFWLKPGLPDTIRVCMHAAGSIYDTTKFTRSGTAQEGRFKRKETTNEGMKIISNTMAGSFDLNKNLTFGFAIPVEDYDPSRIHLYTLTDTIIPVFTFNDSIRRKGIIDYKWLPGEFYHLMIEDSVFCDLGGAYNDSTSLKFKVRQYEDYGILLMNIMITDLPGQLIVQLMTEKEVIIREKVISQAQVVRFDYLMAGNYKLKVIFDNNSNSKWDTGNYGENSLPERVEYYSPTLNIRGNWDLQEDWNLDQPD